jgi:hypothetical protein
MTLAQLAMAVMQTPTTATVSTSPAGGTTYSNLPTFVTAAMNTAGLNGGLHFSTSGRPYVEVSAQLGGAGATAWGYASTLQVSVNGTGYTLSTAGCRYLGSPELASGPGAVAGVGIGDPLDCGVTFREPQQGAQIETESAWTVCYILHARNVYSAPPIGTCTTYPAQMDATRGQKALDVDEIQAGNG